MSIRKKLLFALKVWPFVFAATLGLCYLTTFVSNALGCPLPDQPSLAALRNMHGFQLAKWTVLVVVVAPLVEETIFRFGLFAFPLWMAKRFAGKKTLAAILAVLAVVSSVLFTMAHYRGMRLDNAFAALFFFGLAQCAVCRKTGGILAPFVDHALFNAANMAFLFIFVPAAQ